MCSKQSQIAGIRVSPSPPAQNPPPRPNKIADFIYEKMTGERRAYFSHENRLHSSKQGTPP